MRDRRRGLERHGYDVVGIEYRNGETVIGFAIQRAMAVDIVGPAAVNDAPVAEQCTASLVQNGVTVRAELGDYTLDELVGPGAISWWSVRWPISEKGLQACVHT